MSVRLPSPTLAWRAIEPSVRVTARRRVRGGASLRDQVGDPRGQDGGAREHLGLELGARAAVDVQPERHGERDHHDHQEVGRGEDEPAAQAHDARRLEAEADAADRVDVPRSGRVVAELLAQRAHVHVERLRRAEPRRIPDLVDDLVAAHDLARALQQHAQQLELLHGERPAARRPASRRACPRSTRTSPASSTVPAAGAGSCSLRRRTARIRATSSAALNGFVT